MKFLVDKFIPQINFIKKKKSIYKIIEGYGLIHSLSIWSLNVHPLFKGGNP